MPKFVVVHGSLKLGGQHVAQVGEVVELTAAEAKELGSVVAPEGTPPLKSKAAPPKFTPPAEPAQPSAPANPPQAPEAPKGKASK